MSEASPTLDGHVRDAEGNIVGMMSLTAVGERDARDLLDGICDDELEVEG